MNKEELISCLDRARNVIVKVNNDEEGDFVVKELKEFGIVYLDSKLPSEIINNQYPILIGTGDNDWWTYAYPSDNSNVIEFEEFKKMVESKDEELEVGIGNLNLSEETKIYPSTIKTDNKYSENPFKKPSLKLYTDEELENELNRRKEAKKLKGEEIIKNINKKIEELQQLGYWFDNQIEIDHYNIIELELDRNFDNTIIIKG